MSKLIATNWGSDTGATECYWICDNKRFSKSPYTVESFVGGLYCSACEVGFIPDSMLDDLGVEESEAAAKFGQLERPYGVGEPLTDAEREQNRQNKSEQDDAYQRPC